MWIPVVAAAAERPLPTVHVLDGRAAPSIAWVETGALDELEAEERLSVTGRWSAIAGLDPVTGPWEEEGL